MLVGMGRPVLSCSCTFCTAIPTLLIGLSQLFSVLVFFFVVVYIKSIQYTVEPLLSGPPTGT